MVGLTYKEGLDLERRHIVLREAPLGPCSSPLAQVGVFVLGLKAQNTNLGPNALRDENCMKCGNRK